jgi:hypothetical protein
MFLRALRDVLYRPNALGVDVARPAQHVASAQWFLFSDDDDARYWRRFWTTMAGWPDEQPLVHAWQWLQREHHPAWGAKAMSHIEQRTPCMFVLYITGQNQVPVRCIALAAPGSLYCTVHQPYREQLQRLTRRRRPRPDAEPREV